LYETEEYQIDLQQAITAAAGNSKTISIGKIFTSIYEIDPNKTNKRIRALIIKALPNKVVEEQELQPSSPFSKSDKEITVVVDDFINAIIFKQVVKRSTMKSGVEAVLVMKHEAKLQKLENKLLKSTGDVPLSKAASSKLQRIKTMRAINTKKLLRLTTKSKLLEGKASMLAVYAVSSASKKNTLKKPNHLENVPEIGTKEDTSPSQALNS
jgi:hypothetical protein